MSSPYVESIVSLKGVTGVTLPETLIKRPTLVWVTTTYDPKRFMTNIQKIEVAKLRKNMRGTSLLAQESIENIHFYFGTYYILFEDLLVSCVHMP